jgi:hypothetical protein
MANAQTQVWASATVKAALSKRWDAAASIEQRWRGTEFNQFADLRINRDAKNKWNYFYEFRAPFSQGTKARHTLALEKTFKPKISGLKIAGLSIKQGKHLKWSAMVAPQRDYRGLDILEADFAIVRLGLRYKV